MKVSITFSGGTPHISIGGLEGVLLVLWGRTIHVISKDPTDDTLSTWIDFFIEQEGNGWRFDYRSNRVFVQEGENSVMGNLLTKANQAITQKRVMDLSQEFNALNILEPFVFGGLFARMSERHNPIYESEDHNLALAKMREELRIRLTLNEIESDEHLRNFVLQLPVQPIWVDHTSGEEK